MDLPVVLAICLITNYSIVDVFVVQFEEKVEEMFGRLTADNLNDRVNVCARLLGISVHTVSELYTYTVTIRYTYTVANHTMI